MTGNLEAARERAQDFRDRFSKLESEIARRIVGQREVIRDVLVALFAGGHVLLEGVPGIGKTLLVRTLAEALDARFSRIQFTPDLMPADVLGTRVVVEDEKTGKRAFVFEPGPVFSNVLLADEINRATPKTQSALLEAMQESAVTTAGERRALPEPFFVLATQNPIEMEGTYPLPEAQLDRFFAKLLVTAPDRDELEAIARATCGPKQAPTERGATAASVLAARELVREVPLAPHVERHAAELALATQPSREGAPASVRRFVRYGASPRGVQALVLGAKVRALLAGRFAATVDDVRSQTKAALRHRLILSFDGEAEGVSPDALLDDVLAAVRPPSLEKIS
ncbi:AAA family ATPase [bacterium]|nr:AAA family ATPase [bacterium]